MCGESLTGVTFVTFPRGKQRRPAAARVTFARNVVTFAQAAASRFKSLSASAAQPAWF